MVRSTTLRLPLAPLSLLQKGNDGSGHCRDYHADSSGREAAVHGTSAVGKHRYNARATDVFQQSTPFQDVCAAFTTPSADVALPLDCWQRSTPKPHTTAWPQWPGV